VAAKIKTLVLDASRIPDVQLVSAIYEGYSESKATKSRKIFVKHFFYSLVAFLQYTFIYFSTVTMDRKALSEPGNVFFYSSVVEISRLLS
jgi:hypothetical protein